MKFVPQRTDIFNNTACDIILNPMYLLLPDNLIYCSTKFSLYDVVQA